MEKHIPKNHISKVICYILYVDKIFKVVFKFIIAKLLKIQRKILKSVK
mgnify:CR=1 FL=1